MESMNTQLCSFCYKICREESHTKTSNNAFSEKEKYRDVRKCKTRFLTLLTRYLNFSSQSSMINECLPNETLSLNIKAKVWFEICEDCSRLGNSFCELYFKFECLKLRLDWKVRKLCDTMKCADRVPSRSKSFKSHFYSNGAVGDNPIDQSESYRGYKIVKALRKTIIKKWKQHAKATGPYIFVKQSDLTEKVKNSKPKFVNDYDNSKIKTASIPQEISTIANEPVSLNNDLQIALMMSLMAVINLSLPVANIPMTDPAPNSGLAEDHVYLNDFRFEGIRASQTEQESINVIEGASKNHVDCETMPIDVVDSPDCNDERIENTLAVKNDICSESQPPLDTIDEEELEDAVNEDCVSKPSLVQSQADSVEEGPQVGEWVENMEQGVSFISVPVTKLETVDTAPIPKELLEDHENIQQSSMLEISEFKAVINNPSQTDMTVTENQVPPEQARKCLRSLFKCEKPKCPKTFTNQEKLRIHMNSHRKEAELELSSSDDNDVESDVEISSDFGESEEVINEYKNQNSESGGCNYFGTINDLSCQTKSPLVGRCESPTAKESHTNIGVAEPTKKPRGRPRKKMQPSCITTSTMKALVGKRFGKRGRGRPRKTNQLSRLNLILKSKDFVRKRTQVIPSSNLNHAYKKPGVRESRSLSMPCNVCEVCNKEFSCKAEVEKHRVTEHGIFHYVYCPTCGKWYPDHCKMLRHTIQVPSCKPSDPEKIIPGAAALFPFSRKIRGNKFCPEEGCYEVFRFEECLSIHLKTHGIWHCKICLEPFSKAYDLALHELTNHERNKKDQLMTLDLNNQKKKYSCPRCSFLPQDKLEHYVNHFISKHLKIVKMPTSKTVMNQCPICKDALNPRGNEKNMRNHIKTNHDVEGKDPKSISTCPKCNVPFLLPKQLTAHLKRVHNTMPTFECQHCSKTFKTPSDLRKHKRKFHQDQKGSSIPGRFECPLCHERFEFKKTLENHQEWHTRHDKAHQCDICQKIYKSKNSLRSHIKMMHEPPKKTHCCEQCGKIFKDSIKLQQHHAFVHTDRSEWKFVCPEDGCGRRCFTKQKLTEHIRTHTKERPFICDFCGVAHRYPQYLRAHIKKVHGTNAAATLPAKPYIKPFNQEKNKDKSTAETLVTREESEED